jgi:hypothetical protein
MPAPVQSRKAKVPWNDLSLHLGGYQAKPMPEYSNGKRHVYYSNTIGYITVRKKGNDAHLEFTGTVCPCGWDD